MALVTDASMPSSGKIVPGAQGTAKPGCLAAMLAQFDKETGTLYPLQYASRVMRPSEGSGSVGEGELSAGAWGFQVFHSHLVGCEVHWFTDHRNTASIAQTRSPASRRLWLALAPYNFIPHHIPGLDPRMQPVDTMSRVFRMPQQSTTGASAMVVTRSGRAATSAVPVPVAPAASTTPTPPAATPVVTAAELSVGEGATPATADTTTTTSTTTPAATVGDTSRPRRQKRKQKPQAPAAPAGAERATEPAVEESGAPARTSTTTSTATPRADGASQSDGFLQRLAAAQQESNEQEKWRRDNNCRQREFGENKTLLWANIQRPIVPRDSPILQNVLELAHDHGAHCGVRRTMARIRDANLYITGLEKVVSAYVGSCWECQRARNGASSNEQGLFHTRPHAGAPLKRWQVDYLGPLPETHKGNKYVFSALDTFTRYLVLEPCAKADSSSTIACLKKLFANFGIPEELQRDNGTHFDNTAVSKFLRELGVKVIATTPHHPQSNGKVERQNAVIEKALRAACSGIKFSGWDDYLWETQLAINTAENRMTGETPLRVLAGVSGADRVAAATGATSAEDRTVPEQLARLQAIRGAVASREERTHEEMRDAYDVGRRAVTFNVGDQVLLKRMNRANKLDFLWRGPYRVTERLSDTDGTLLDVYRVMELASQTGRPERVHVDCMIPYDGSRSDELTEIARQMADGVGVLKRVLEHRNRNGRVQLHLEWLFNDRHVERVWEDAEDRMGMHQVRQYCEDNELIQQRKTRRK
jgi:transposase InsO family protein